MVVWFYYDHKMFDFTMSTKCCKPYTNIAAPPDYRYRIGVSSHNYKKLVKQIVGNNYK